MSKRSMVSAGVRTGVGVVAVAIGAAVVAGATLLPLPTLSETPAGRVVTPVALDQQRVCAGSLLQLNGDSGASATSVTAGSAARTVTAAGSTGSGAVQKPTTDSLKGSDGAASKPLLVTAEAKGSTTVPAVAAAQSAASSTSALKGFAASPCAEPTSSTWLVGGSTETGRTSLINLVNASDVNSTVDLAVYGEDGKVEGPGLTGIVVAPGSQKVVPLSGFATGLASPVVHVVSRGGQISSSLQVSVVRTLEAGGLDTVSASASPSRSVTVPGVIVHSDNALQTATGKDGYGDLLPILRTYVPGSVNARIAIEMRTADGTGATFSVTAQAGQVTDIPLDGLATGQYTAFVTSNVPVVAGTRTSTLARDGDIDLAWAAAAPSLSGSTLFAVPTGPSPRLVVANPTSKVVSATLSVRGKSATRLQVPSGGSVAVALSPGAVGSLSEADGLRAALSFSSSSQVASYALFSPTAVSTPVTVYP